MNFCDVDVQDFVPVCGFDFAGLVGIGFIHYYENPTNEQLESSSFWQAVLDDTPHRYFALKNIRGEYNGGEPIEEDDLVGKRVTGANHVASFDSTGLLENWQFWDEIRKNMWKIVLINAGGTMFYVNKPCSVYPKITNPKSVTAQAFFNTEVKWHSLANPVVLEAPEGIFTGNLNLNEAGFNYTLNFSFV